MEHLRRDLESDAVNPAQEVLSRAAQEVRAMVMSEFDELAGNMRPIEMSSVDAKYRVNVDETTQAPGFILDKPDRIYADYMVVLSPLGIHTHDYNSHHSLTAVPRMLDHRHHDALQEETLWLRYGAQAMKLLVTERRHQTWLAENSELSQAAKDAEYIWDFNLWLHDFGSNNRPFGNRKYLGFVGSMKRFGYTREEAIAGWLELGLDILDMEQKDKDRDRALARSLGLEYSEY